MLQPVDIGRQADSAKHLAVALDDGDSGVQARPEAHSAQHIRRGGDRERVEGRGGGARVQRRRHDHRGDGLPGVRAVDVPPARLQEDQQLRGHAQVVRCRYEEAEEKAALRILLWRGGKDLWCEIRKRRWVSAPARYMLYGVLFVRVLQDTQRVFSQRASRVQTDISRR